MTVDPTDDCTFWYTNEYLTANGTFTGTPVSARSSSRPAYRLHPAFPTGLTPTPGNNQVSLSWTAPSGATGYNVKRATTQRRAIYHRQRPEPDFQHHLYRCHCGQRHDLLLRGQRGRARRRERQLSEVFATPATVPGAPTGPSAVAGNGQATVSWTIPADNGGSAITSYTAKSTPGSLTATVLGATATSVIVRG